ncbi:uncharacterized protein [Rutidosis leptorrhynchoides]|uniref:uncharacterized protein n=1 Tax=Rutidosis leptorrhynchoides TaxID=125765 RepID=UPI003A99A05B
MQHKFEQPNFLQDMIAKFCAENTDTRTKKVTEITTTADKFVQHISDYPIVAPPIVPATLGVYSGLTDPLDFLQRFEGVVSTYNWDEPVACRVFPMVLQGSAREWFHILQARSIIGFIDLRDKFLLHFQNLLPHKKTHIECHDIKQGNKETLNRHPTLVRRLRRDVSPTFAKVQQETYDYLRGGEDCTITPACGWGKDKSWRHDNDSFHDGNGENYRGSGYPLRNGCGGYPRNDRYQGENSRRDRSKFCVFHDDYGHDTNRCRDLAKLITEAYEQGKLDHLITQGAASTANVIIMPAETNALQVPNVAERKAPAVKNLGVKMVSKKENQRGIQVINMVEVQGEMSVLQIAEQIVSWKCPSITFPPASLTADVDKPVVVSCRIANTGIVIMKVHVDTGSSVDVMFEQCFSKLPANIQALVKPTAASLAGFSGESTWHIGQLELQIELVDDCDELLRRQASLNLYIIQNQSRFNMILGRTVLRMFGAIPYIIHGMVKFSANKGIGTLIYAKEEPICAMIIARGFADISNKMA